VRVLDTHNGIARIMCDDGTEHAIESEYVQEPALVKTREIVRPLVSASDLEYRLVILDEEAATKPHAARYIRWGEVQGFHRRPTTRSRRPWYVIKRQETAHVAIPIGHKRRPVVAVLDDVSVSDNLVQVACQDSSWANVIAGSVLSTWSMLLFEVTGRANFGQGLLKTQTYEIADLPVLDPRSLSEDDRARFEACFESMSKRPFLMIYDGVRLADRDALDSTFLQAIGITDAAQRKGILEELQQEVCKTIWNRMAKSATSREARMTYAEWLATEQPFDSQAGEDDET